MRIAPLAAQRRRKMKLDAFLARASLTALALASATVQARAQQTLPTIDVGAARPKAAAQGRTTGSGGDEGSAGVGNNGTSIGPGANGQICADGICDDPKSYAAPVQSLGTKVNTPAIETPLATKTITHQQLEDQQVTTVDQALRDVSGAYLSGGGSSAIGVPYSAIVLRGFPVSAYYRDGVRFDTFAGNAAGIEGLQLADVESLEILKGPAAILYGAVEPGGIVNVNTKQPLDKPAYSIQQQIGSYQSYRTTLDATGPLSTNKDLLYRFTASYENDGSFQTYGYTRNLLLTPVVKWNYDADTWIKVSDQYTENMLNQNFTIIPYYNNVVPLWLGRAMNYAPPSPYKQQQNIASVTLHHDFNKDWSVEQKFVLRNLTARYDNDIPFSFMDCITPGSNTCFGGPPGAVQVISDDSLLNDVRQLQFSTVLDVTGHVKTGELDHTLLLGADYYRFNSRIQGLTTTNNNVVTLFAAPGTPPSAVLPSAQSGFFQGNAAEQYADNVGAYFQDQIKLPYGFNVLAGARYQYIDSRTSEADPTNVCGNLAPTFYLQGLAIPCNFDTQTIRGEFTAQRVTPRAALLWRPYEWVSLYGNYVESYSPNYNGLLVLGTNMPNPPSAGQQEEAGVKFSLLDNMLQISADYYHLVKTNIPVGIPSQPAYELLVGEARAQGPELDIQGQLLPGWNVNLAYANIDTKITKADYIPLPASENPVLGSPFPYTPRNVASISSTYDFQNPVLKGLKVGASYYYAGYLPNYHYNFDGSYIYSQPTPSYGLVGLLAAYDFDYNGMKIHTQINVDNLLDRTYFLQGGLNGIPFDNFEGPFSGAASPGYSSNFNQNTVIGAPRTIRGLIKVAF
jgi:iron complex outermembrane recepter protein